MQNYNWNFKSHTKKNPDTIPDPILEKSYKNINYFFIAGLDLIIDELYEKKLNQKLKFLHSFINENKIFDFSCILYTRAKVLK